MTDRSMAFATLALALAAAGLAGCGGGSTATLGGTVSGLPAGSTVTLQDNNGNELNVSTNGAYQFSGTYDGGSSYSVTVLDQPAGAVCSVDNATGTIGKSGGTVGNIDVTCAATSSLAGTLSGLNPGTAVTLSDGTVLLPLATNGAFAFPGTLATNSTYNVVVATQPVGETCTVVNGSGVWTGATTAAITVTCVAG